MWVLGIEPNFHSKGRKALNHSVIPPSQDRPGPSWRLAQAHLVNEKSQGSEGLGDSQKTGQALKPKEPQRTWGHPCRGASGAQLLSLEWEKSVLTGHVRHESCVLPPQLLLPDTYQEQEATPPLLLQGQMPRAPTMFPQGRGGHRSPETKSIFFRDQAAPFRCLCLPPAA